MPILYRTLLAFGALFVVGFVQSAITVFSLDKLAGEISSAASKPVTQVDAARSAWEAFQQADKYLEDSLGTIRYESSADVAARFTALAADIDKELARFKAVASDSAASADAAPAEDVAAVDEAMAVTAEWRKDALVLVGGTPAAAIPTPHVMEKFRTSLRDKLQKLVAMSLEQANLRREQAEASAAGTRSLALILAVAAMVIGIGIAVPLALTLTRPMARLEKRMLGMIEGDLKSEIADQHRRDEIGRIAQALGYFRDRLIERSRLEANQVEISRTNEERLREVEAAFTASGQEQAAIVQELGVAIDGMARGDLTVRMTEDVAANYRKLTHDFNSALASLEKTVRMVSGTTDEIRVGADEMAQSAGDLSVRTEQQAANIRNVASAIGQITATVKKTADGATRARQAVNAANTEAGASGAVVRKAIEAMDRIENTSRQVSQIIDVIDEIAFQTNLLALNAGVEAARAGDQGRGFAVVASEVRALAQRCTVAAKEINELISISQPEVAQGVELVGQAGKALDAISAQVQSISAVIAEIASDAVEQSNSLGNINDAIAQMENSTQQNAVMVEESTTSTYAFKSKADELTERIQRFHIDDGGLRPRHQLFAGPARQRWQAAG